MQPDELDPTPLLRVDVPDGVLTYEEAERLARGYRSTQSFTLPEGVKFEVDLSEVERNRWTPEEYGA